jgi:hypothetical protein
MVIFPLKNHLAEERFCVWMSGFGWPFTKDVYQKKRPDESTAT